jgi:hypothetical protein
MNFSLLSLTVTRIDSNRAESVAEVSADES